MYHVSKKERRRIEIPIDRHDATPSAAQRPRTPSASLWYLLGTQATRATRKRGTTAKVDSRNERRSIAVRCGAARRGAERSDQTSDLSALVIDIGRPRRVPIASHRSHCYSPFTAFAYRKPRNMRHRRRRFHRGQDPEYQMFQLSVQGKRRGRQGSARTAFNHARYENL